MIIVVWTNLETLDTTLGTSKKSFVCMPHAHSMWKKVKHFKDFCLHTHILVYRGAHKLSLLWSIFYAARLFRMHVFHIAFYRFECDGAGGGAAARRRRRRPTFNPFIRRICIALQWFKYRNIIFFWMNFYIAYSLFTIFNGNQIN